METTMRQAMRHLPFHTLSSLFLLASLAIVYSPRANSHDPLPRWRGELPSANFDHPAEKPFDASDYVFKFDQLGYSYRTPGEFLYRMIGEDYGFEALSVFITETHPNGGPRLHSHDVEEAHVLLEGSVRYVIGDRTFSVEAPYIAKVPANVPHTFMNAGTEPMHIIAVFPSKRPSIKIVGPNPLLPSQPPR
jgi:mannose-6-phosphate isomerase-like protein (cupin superfamily)